MNLNDQTQEPSPLYARALDLYRGVSASAHTEDKMLNNHLRLYALRILGHAKTAVDGPNAKVRKRAIEFALSNAPKLEATVDATWADQLLTQEKHDELVKLVRSFQLACAPPIPTVPLEEVPAANDATVAPTARDILDAQPPEEGEAAPVAAADPAVPARSTG